MHVSTRYVLCVSRRSKTHARPVVAWTPGERALLEETSGRVVMDPYPGGFTRGFSFQTTVYDTLARSNVLSCSSCHNTFNVPPTAREKCSVCARWEGAAETTTGGDLVDMRRAPFMPWRERWTYGERDFHRVGLRLSEHLRRNRLKKCAVREAA